MNYFEHLNVESTKEATRHLKKNQGKARLIAGGTDLLGVLKDRVLPEAPTLLLNLKTIQGLDTIKEDAEGLRIGALTRLSDITASPIVREKYPVLADAAESVATPLIRNIATIGGNLCQEVRCWYYRYPHHIGGRILCARKRGEQPQTQAQAQAHASIQEGTGCSALTGENRYHSIFGAAKVCETPCTDGCPASIDIPAYMESIRKKDFKGAARKLLETNPMPGITGRICPHTCQDACSRGDYDVAVSIRAVERMVGDYILARADKLMPPPKKKTGMKVAVIGAGPAGLSAAYYLRIAGHGVTVFDRMDKPGGMLAHAVPNFRLPARIVDRLIRAYEQMGIRFKPRTPVGEKIKIQDLKKDFDALFLATGAWATPSIDLHGEDLSTPGLEFLADAKRGKKPKPGKRVLVIGGGNVAVDVGITAGRLGAEQVTLACLESREDMPALEWEIQKALEEGIEVMPSWGPSGVSRAAGNSLQVNLARCISVFDETGKFAPVCDESDQRTLEVDRVILAVGQRPELDLIKGQSRIKTKGGLIQVKEDTQETGLKGVFAAGDVTTGPATVVGALAAGRRAAHAIHRFLTGPVKSAKGAPGGTARDLLAFHSASLGKTNPQPVPERSVQDRRIHLEDVYGLDSGSARMEADRCFNCGCVAVNASDTAPVLVALDATIRTTKRTLPAEDFFSMAAGRPSLLDPDEILTEILIPRRSKAVRLAYDKFRVRKSLDFSVVSLASAFRVTSGKFRDVRLVLGAAAPVPVRLTDVERFLKGKKPGKRVAEQAAAMAADKVIPLSENAYKIQIMKTLVKRSIINAG